MHVQSHSSMEYMVLISFKNVMDALCLYFQREFLIIFKSGFKSSKVDKLSVFSWVFLRELPNDKLNIIICIYLFYFWVKTLLR